MPLVRYEVRCEHRLANSELFRSAARDDPEGLLEGVAVAGLIGIVRQLGDLAEFAAEVFRDLHDELTKVGGRAFDLTVRLHQLEAELPSVEKGLLSEPNQLRFAYTNGADWHASIRSDQNHCTSGELPRFVRNFYEECRGPPRLFLLDKFDVAGSGACLKRYTDPSFFKLEWARSELMKAQRAQRDKKARREKKKGRRRKTGQAIAAINQIPARVRYGSASLEDLDNLSHLLASTLKDEVSTSSSHQSVNHGPGMQPQRWSNLVPKGKMIGRSLPPIGASAPQPVVGASKPLKISAKDIEANTSGKFYQPSEPESVAESMAGKISKIIEMGDRDAVPSAGLIPRNVGSKFPKVANGSRTPAIDAETKVTYRATKNDLEAAAMARAGRTSRGTSSSNASMDAREGFNPANWRTSQSSVPDITPRSNVAVDSVEEVKPANMRASQTSMPNVSLEGNASMDAKEDINPGDFRTSSSNIPDSTGLPDLQEYSSRTNSTDVPDPIELIGNVSRSSVDAKEAHITTVGFTGQDSERHSKCGNDFANAPGTSTFEGLSGVEGMNNQAVETYEAEDRHGDSHHSHRLSTQHARTQKYSFTPTVDQQSLPNHGSLAYASDPSHGVDERHSLTEAPAYDRDFPSTACAASEDSPSLSLGGEPAFHDGHLSDTQRLANNAENTREVLSNLEETVYQHPDLPPVRVEVVLVYEEGSRIISGTSPTILSQWSSAGVDHRPSASMLSRFSYSSELVSVTSVSEPDSPISPKSPAFNALYSPHRLPSRFSGDMSESPPGIHMGSYLRSDHHSGLCSPQSEIPVLSLSPKSPLASPSPVLREDKGDHAVPSRPPPPPPIVDIVSENPSHFEGRHVVNASNAQLYPSPSPSLNPHSDLSTRLESSSQSNGGPSYLTRHEENAGKVRAEPRSQSPDNLDLLQGPTSSRDLVAHFEEPSTHIEEMQTPVAFSKGEVQSRSTVSIPSVTESSRSSLTSPFGTTDSATMQSPEQRFVHSDPQQSLELRSVDALSDGPTFDIDSVTPPVGGFKADPFSEARQGPLPNPSFTDFVRSSLILPRRPSDSPSSSTHTSPLGSPKQHFQRIFLTNPTVQPTPSPLGQAMQNAPPSFSMEDEDSVPSSPTGSVIIKDTPSPPGSPASNYSEGESAIPEFRPRYDQPKSPVLPRSVAHVMEDIVNHGKTSSGEIHVQEDPRFVSSHSGAASAVSIQEGGPLNFESEKPDHGYSFPEDRVEAPASHTPAQHDTAHEETLLHASLPPSPHLDSGPNSPLHSTEAATLRPVSIRSAPKSQNSSASNSPPDSPPRKQDLAGADEALTLEWRGRLQPDSTSKTGLRVPPASPGRSPSNSPPTSPPKFSDQSNLLRWKRRSEPATIKTDYALPPNLVCRSETSSPPCSPPPQSESESPKQWDKGSEVSSSSDSSESSDSTKGIQNGVVEVYRLPDSPLPSYSPAMSEDGDSSSGTSSKSESDEEVDNAAEHEHGMVQTSTSGSGLENPSNSSSDKSSFEVPSSEPEVSNGRYQPSDAQFRPSTFETSPGPVLPVSLSQLDSIQKSTVGSETNFILTTDPPLPPPALGSMDNPATKDALAAAIAHHDWNMMKALTFKDPGNRPFPPPDERSILLEQIRTESFSLHRTGHGMETKDHITRPSANINVAAILEKANAIRQAFVGSDDEDGDEGDWSDS